MNSITDSIPKIALCSLFCVFLANSCSDKTTTVNFPNAPDNLAGQVLSSSSISLTWADNSDNESNFLIYRRQSGDWSQVASVLANVTIFTDTLLQDTTYYSYRVSAKNSGGESGISNVISLTTFGIGLPPLTPAIISPPNGAIDISISTELAWSCNDPDSDSLNYDLYFGSGGYLSRIDSNLIADHYSISDLQYGIQYNWKVVAKDSHHHATAGPVWSFTSRNPLPCTLTVLLQGLGTVTRIPDQDELLSGDSVQLTANAETGWFFAFWAGDTSTTTNPLALVIHRNLTLIATFHEGTSPATISGNVSWPGHALTSHTFVFADTVNNFQPFRVAQATVNPNTGDFQMTINNIITPLRLRFEAQDDVNNSGTNHIDSGDGWGFYDLNSDTSWSAADEVIVAPGDQITDINIVLNLWP
jgi:hypothetical protein